MYRETNSTISNLCFDSATRTFLIDIIRKSVAQQIENMNFLYDADISLDTAISLARSVSLQFDCMLPDPRIYKNLEVDFADCIVCGRCNMDYMSREMKNLCLDKKSRIEIIEMAYRMVLWEIEMHNLMYNSKIDSTIAINLATSVAIELHCIF